MSRARLKVNNTRLGWYKYYAARFDKTGNPDAAHLAMWYLLLSLAFDTP